MQKYCHACNAIRQKGNVPTEAAKARHDCRENHFGKSSKSMEATAAVLLQRKLHERFVTMCSQTDRVLSVITYAQGKQTAALRKITIHPFSSMGLFFCLSPLPLRQFFVNLSPCWRNEVSDTAQEGGGNQCTPCP